MPALTIKYVPLDDLAVHEENPKTHDLDEIAASVRRFGFADPVIVDERTGKLAAGHGRLASLSRMRDGGEDAPDGIRVKAGVWHVPRVVGWASRDDDEARAALVALNRTTEVGGWDDRALVDLLGKLENLDDGLAGLGYRDDDLQELRARLGDYAPEFAPVGPDEQPRLDERTPIVCGACGTTVDPKTGEVRA